MVDRDTDEIDNAISGNFREAPTAARRKRRESLPGSPVLQR